MVEIIADHVDLTSLTGVLHLVTMNNRVCWKLSRGLGGFARTNVETQTQTAVSGLEARSPGTQPPDMTSR